MTCTSGIRSFTCVCVHTRATDSAQPTLPLVVHRLPTREGRPMRWQALFDALEAQLAAAEVAELQAEVAAGPRREAGAVRVVDRLTAAVGQPVTVTLGMPGVL